MYSETETILRVEGVVKDFGGLRALNNVSLCVKQGEIKGIIGPNGSGKTTLFNVISGIYKPTAGKVFLNGRPIHNLRPSDIARLGIGRTFQIVRPFRNLTALHNVLAALGHKFYQGTLKPLFLSPEKEHVEEAYRLLKLVGLEGYEHTSAKDLPLVFQRRLEVARALALKPTLLMFDEPMAGLSLEAINDMMKLISDVNKRGTAILLIEHNVRVAMELSNSIVVLNYGIKICEGTPDKIRSDPEVIKAYLGTRWGTV
jgi:branched-chain amino acid transport system ATP-binding protein